MSTTEIVLFGLLFTAVALAVVIPALRWYKYNVSMVLKKRFSVYFMAAFITIVLLMLIIAAFR